MMASTINKALVGALALATVGGTMAISTTPAAAWHRGYGHAYYGGAPYAYRRHHRGRGAAVAAGVAGGLALGALAAGAARPAYAVPAEECYTVRRRVVDDWGRVYFRRQTVCE
jgi:hypothetical protein